MQKALCSFQAAVCIPSQARYFCSPGGPSPEIPQKALRSALPPAEVTPVHQPDMGFIHQTAVEKALKVNACAG